MKKGLMLLSILTSFIFVSSTFASSQPSINKSFNFISEKDRIWFENNPDSLPIWLTQEELQRLDEIGKGFQSTGPPPSPVRMPAEFEPMQGVLIRYPFGISYEIIAEMSEDVEVVTIVASESERYYVFSQYHALMAPSISANINGGLAGSKKR